MTESARLPIASGLPSVAVLPMTRSKARRIASNIAKLPGLLKAKDTWLHHAEEIFGFGRRSFYWVINAEEPGR